MMTSRVKVHSINLWISNAYLVEAPRGMVLIDAGLAGQSRPVFRLLERLKRDDLRWIFLSHAHGDHTGSAAQIRDRSGAAIALHGFDADDARRGASVLGSIGRTLRLDWPLVPLLERAIRTDPIPVDRELADLDRLEGLGVSARVLHTPGHTQGSATLIVDERHAFVGDLISGSGKPHLQRTYAQDWDALAPSARKLLSLDLETIYPGHGRVIRAEGLHLLRAAIVNG